MRVTFLGSGTSFGVPVVGCTCPVCSSPDPRDARFRASILVEADGAAVVVDAGPEFRLQCLRAGIGIPGGAVPRLDALLVTHAHADHVAGLDDVRPLTRDRVLPVYGNAEALAELRERFGYIFRETQAGGGKPRVQLIEACPEGIRLGAGGTLFIPIPLLHGRLPILGWRVGSFAYLTDCSEIPESSFGLLTGIQTLVVNGLRRRPHETHFNFEQALAAARRAGARRTWITHLCHDESHESAARWFAAEGRDLGAAPAWDTLALDLPETGSWPP